MATLFELPAGIYTRRRQKPTDLEMLDALRALEDARRELMVAPGDRLEALRQVERALVIVNRATS